jgi:hypothetical protein
MSSAVTDSKGSRGCAGGQGGRLALGGPQDYVRVVLMAGGDLQGPGLGSGTGSLHLDPRFGRGDCPRLLTGGGARRGIASTAARPRGVASRFAVVVAETLVRLDPRDGRFSRPQRGSRPALRRAPL